MKITTKDNDSGVNFPPKTDCFCLKNHLSPQEDMP